MESVLDRLVESDAHNFEESKRALTSFDSRMLEGVEVFSALMKDIGDAFGATSGYDKYEIQLNDWLGSQPGNPQEKVRFLEQATLLGEVQGEDPVTEARTSLHRANSVVARTFLILRIRRDFLFGVSDLLKLRLIPALGYLRIQSESAAILALLGNDPSIAAEWLAPDSGKSFYNKYHKRVVAKLNALSLHDYYDQGSAMALHSRVPGVTPGILVGEKGASEGSIELAYQEIDDPLDLFVWFFIFLRAHARVIGGIVEGLPEIDHGKVGVGEYIGMISALGEKLKPVYIKQRKSGLINLL